MICKNQVLIVEHAGFIEFDEGDYIMKMWFWNENLGNTVRIWTFNYHEIGYFKKGCLKKVTHFYAIRLIMSHKIYQKHSSVQQKLISYLLSFNLFWAQRLRSSQSDIECLTPKFAVTAFASQGCCCGNPCRSHRSGWAGNWCRDNTCLYCPGWWWRRRGYMRLTHIPKTDGALQTHVKSKFTKDRK